jgi:hypothetical protein
MDFADPQKLAAYVVANAAHECGHMVILFKSNRLLGLNFLPHETAEDGVKGVIETDTPTLGKEDCVAFAGGLVAELICFGLTDSPRLADDGHKVQQIAGQPLENFAHEAYEIIKQNLVFFALLNIEVRKKTLKVLLDARSSSLKGSYAGLSDKISIITLAEVEMVYKQAESTLAGFPQKT